MLAAAEVASRAGGRARVACAKLLHARDQRCIHCGYMPPSPIAVHDHAGTPARSSPHE
jgi:hypothetical protein